MIAFTYVASGVLLTGSGALFAQGTLSAAQQTFAWSVIFFFASAAASSAYLTVSETFPLEIRALAIALFYAIGTGIGGVIGPALFGVLIDTGLEMPEGDADRIFTGWNYWLTDSVRAGVAYGRQFGSSDNHGIWTLGISYRFVR